MHSLPLQSLPLSSAVDYRINLPNSKIVSVVGSASENCFMVSIAMDGVAEGTEVVEFTLMPTSSIPANLSIQITMATTQLVIKDLDSKLTITVTERDCPTPSSIAHCRKHWYWCNCQPSCHVCQPCMYCRELYMHDGVIEFVINFLVFSSSLPATPPPSFLSVRYQ